jgi:hypothetical protein
MIDAFDTANTFSGGLGYIRPDMKCLQLNPHQRLGALPKDAHAKKDVAYLLVDRSHEWTVLCQSLPLLAKWVNENVSSGERCDRVTVTGLFENMDKTDGASGGWHKGRYRVSRVPLKDSSALFDSVRGDHKNAAIVGHNIRAREKTVLRSDA